MMKITYKTFPEKEEYQSLLIVNEADRWKESLYFTFYTPWGEDETRLYSGRYMSDVHFKNKECECVLAFDFHDWDSATVDAAMQQNLPPLAIKHDLREVLQQALEARAQTPDGFTFSLRPIKVKK